jgi:hypothetical protein
LYQITAIRDPVEELVILSRAHGVDGHAEVPRLSHVIERADFALLAMPPPAERLGCGTLVDGHESERVGGERRARGRDGGYPVAGATGELVDCGLGGRLVTDFWTRALVPELMGEPRERERRGRGKGRARIGART